MSGIIHKPDAGVLSFEKRLVRSSALPPGVLPRGLSRKAASEYVGVSPSKFDQMVQDKQMPAPRRIGGRVIWDRHALDEAFDDLPTDDDANPWD